MQKDKIAQYSIWSIFGIFLLYSMSLVFMYFDDFGYASLSYSYVEPNVQGTNYTLSQFLNYLSEIYMRWSGRVLFPGIKILLLRNGVWPMRIVQAISVLFSFVFLCRFATRNNYNVWTAIFACSLYGLFSFQMFRTGFYWFSASATYVVPLVFVFFGFVIYRYLDENNDIKCKKLYIVIGAISFFLASASVEPTSFAIVISLFILLLIKNIKPIAKLFESDEDKKQLYPYLFFAVSLLGSSFLFLAPGNFMRFFHDGATMTLSSFYHTVMYNLFIFTVLHYEFNRGVYLLLILLTAFVISCAYFLWKNNRISKNLLLISIPFSIFFLYGSIQFDPYTHILDSGPANLSVYLVCYSFLAFMIFLAVEYLLFIKDKFLLVFFTGALLSQVLLMLYSPYMVNRMALVFYFALFALYIRMFNDIKKFIELKTIIITIVLPILIVSSINLAFLTYGYALNREVNAYNDAHLRQISAQIKQGIEIEYIEIPELADSRYAYDLSERTFEWMKRYYGIPLHIPIVKR